VKEGRFVGCLDPKVVGDLSDRLRKNIEATTKQHPVGFDPREIFIIGNKHHQKHDPVQGQVVYLRVMVSEEVLDEPVDRHPESAMKEVDEDYNVIKVGGGHILAKGTPVTRKLPWHQEPPTIRFLISSSVVVDTVIEPSKL
jgi:hypothetical protein